MKPEMVNFFVVGGEMNPMSATTNFTFNRTISIDKWIPKAGIKKDAKPCACRKRQYVKTGAAGLAPGLGSRV